MQVWNLGGAHLGGGSGPLSVRGAGAGPAGEEAMVRPWLWGLASVSPSPGGLRASLPGLSHSMEGVRAVGHPAWHLKLQEPSFHQTSF